MDDGRRVDGARSTWNSWWKLETRLLFASSAVFQHRDCGCRDRWSSAVGSLELGGAPWIGLLGRISVEQGSGVNYSINSRRSRQ